MVSLYKARRPGCIHPEGPADQLFCHPGLPVQAPKPERKSSARSTVALAAIADISVEPLGAVLAIMVPYNRVLAISEAVTASNAIAATTWWYAGARRHESITCSQRPMVSALEPRRFFPAFDFDRTTTTDILSDPPAARAASTRLRHFVSNWLSPVSRRISSILDCSTTPCSPSVHISSIEEGSR